MPNEQTVPRSTVSFLLRDTGRGKYASLIARAVDIPEEEVYIITLSDKTEVKRYRSGLCHVSKQLKVTVHLWQVGTKGASLDIPHDSPWPRRYAVLVED